MSSRLLTALLLLGLLQNAAPSSLHGISKRSPGCPDGWNELRFKTCMRLFTEKKTFDEAEQHCVSLGGHLVSIHGGGEFYEVLTLAVKSYRYAIPVWTGARYNEQEQRWKWTDGTSFSFVHQHGSLTDKKGGCVEMNRQVWGGWKIMNCDVKQFYVCAKRS
ncbi:unnamed protein product [Tetraodon nigroviridis]|uniref:(spotted green pufferfish) hypothetical protein n=1 Tax=Tetraodon nigroviridis TaxID=99883 RepID=Q4S497_TETNG|nr:unnamed protein product [Tetraodon nigroviridis]